MRKLARAFAVLTLLSASLVFAHATVRTEAGLAESKAGVSETYRLQVPVEKPMATVEVRLVVPAGFVLTRFLQTPGWERTVVKNADGLITQVTWKGKVEDGEFARFIFQGRNPKDPTRLYWKVYQKYADGSVVAWEKEDPQADTPASAVEIK
ncbi:MAG: nuclear export factor GLE1 [Meiothermus sp.]